MLRMADAPVMLSMLVSSTGSIQSSPPAPSGSRFEAGLLNLLFVPAGTIVDVPVGKS